jgi:predicted ester cyclase
MTAEDNVATTRRLVEAWKSHDLERIRTFFDESFENHQPPLAPVIGLDAYIEHCRHWFEAYPDRQMEIVILFGAGDLVCLGLRGRGTRQGTFFGNEANGRLDLNSSLDVLEFRNGKIVRELGFWDFSVLTGELAPMAGGHRDPRSAFFRGEAVGRES